MGLLRFPRIARAPEHDGEDELSATLEIFKRIRHMPYCAQERVLKHVAEICVDNHNFHEAARDDAGNGLG